MKVGLVGLALCVVVAGCGAEPPDGGSPRTRCEQLREKLVGLQMQPVTADRDQHRAAFRAALGDRFVTACLAMPSDERDCALAAEDAAALAACHVN